MAIRENLELIRQNIEKACQRAKSDPRQVRILAVCKDQGPEKISQVLDLGVRLLGENKSQEAEAHMRHFAGNEHRLALHRQAAEKQDQQAC